MSKKFRNWSPDQTWLLPPSPRDWLDEGHLVYFLLDVVGEMDLSPFFERYKNSVSGQPPFHPRMMVTLLLYSYCSGVFSSRKIQTRCGVDVAFRVLVGEDIPDFRTISDFRKDNLEHMQSLFVQTLQVCAEAGLVKLGRVALDGAKVKANASRHKAMSYDRMKAEEQRLQQEIDALLAQAEASDSADDDRHGDELPEELKCRKSRLAKILEAKAALEEAARAKAKAHVDKMEAAGRNHRTNPDEAVPKPKDQRNFTDPESKIMKTSNKGFDQCGNAQAVANEQQIVIAADVTDQANDVRQTVPMVNQTIDNLDAAGVTENVKAFTADARYFSEENMVAVDENDRIDDAFIATGRQKHKDVIPDSPKGRPPNDLIPKQKMARRN